MLKKIVLLLILLCLLAWPTQAQGPIHLPIILKAGVTMPNQSDPILRVVSGSGTIIDLLGYDSGIELADPYWSPQVAAYKQSGSYINSMIAEGERLVHKEYSNVTESIPFSVRATDQDKAMKTINDLLALGHQGADYWTEFSQFDPTWLEVKLACNSCFTGYARIVKATVPELSSVFSQPFFGPYNEAVMEDLTFIVEREPLWRGVPPGEVVGPLYNLAKNPDFELWNFGVEDSQPDSWSDLETIQITGQNSRQTTAPHSGNYALKVRVSGSTAAGRVKGVSQVIADTKANTQYTAIVWVRSEGVSNGVGRVLVTYSGQLELYRASGRHGWGIFARTFTTGTSDTVAINLEILTTAANTDGTVYFDSLMLIEGDWVEEAENGILPYMSSSHVVNHWDQPGKAALEAGDINYIDVWGVPGNEDALVRLEFMNNSSPAEPSEPSEIYAKLRIGQRRAGDVFKFDNYLDPNGVTDTTASGDDYITSPVLPATEWKEVITKLVIGSDKTLNSMGRFRLLARVYDTKSSGDPTLQVRSNYFVGSGSIADKPLDGVSVPVRAQWCLINLTPNAALIWDRKFSLPPGQMGYKVEMRRSTGNDVGRFDYSIAIPTDGGYFEATIEPSLTYQVVMSVDGTTLRPAIGVSDITVGFRRAYTTVGTQAGGLVYKDALYIGAEFAELHRFRNGLGELVYDYGGGLIADLEEHDGLLHIAAFTTIYKTDGSTFPGTSLGAVPSTGGVVAVHGLKSFDGKLFIGLSSNGRIYSHDGSSYTLSLSTGTSGIYRFGIYNNRLYAGTRTPARVYEYNPVSDSWSLVYTPPPADATEIFSFQVFNGKLYMGSGPNGRLYVFDGSAWSESHDFGSTDIDNIWSLGVFNNKFYAGGETTGAGFGHVMVTEDAITWEKVYDQNTQYILNIKEYLGSLYLFSGQIKATDFDLLVLTTGEIPFVEYGITDWQGSPFTSPAQKRHRYVFSYDRENFINNVDDKALVGLGFVPRYLSLRGRF